LVCSAVQASDAPVAIREWSTVATPARPEAHLLIRNRTSVPLVFTLELGGITGGPKVECAGARVPEPDFLTRFHYWNGVSFGDSRGLIPPNGWTHRSILLGEQGMIPPCHVPYRLRIENDSGEGISTIDGEIQVGVQGPPVRGDATGEDVAWEVMVEQHKLYPDRLVARIAVENRTDHGVVVEIDRRTLTCEGSGGASWAAHHGVVQGEDSGPVQIDAKGVGVFVAAIETWDLDDPAECTVGADIVLDTRSGLKRLKRIEFDLSPSGFLDAATRGRR
jgi:hypothetical protein